MDDATKTMIKTLLTGQAKLAGAAASSFLVTHHLMDPSSSGVFVDLVVAGVLGVAASAYAWWTSVGRANAEEYLKKMTGTSSIADAKAVAEKVAPSVPPEVAAVRAVVLTKVALVALASAVVLALLTPPVSAQQRKPQFTGNLIKDVQANNAAGLGVLTPQQILDGVAKVNLDWLKYAKAQAKAANNVVTLPCWSAWVDLIEVSQKELTGDDGKVVPKPDPNPFGNLESASELLQALQPGGTVQVGCGAMIDATKKSMLQLATGIISGNVAGLLPIPIP